MKISIKKGILIGLGIFLFSGLVIGCGKEEKRDEDKKEYITIEEGLKYRILEEGEGEKVENGEDVRVNYVGKLENGTEFDKSYERGSMLSFEVGATGLIEGWIKGIPGMKLGEKREIVIPPEYGYGDKQQGRIPPNSTLIFEITLEEIVE